MQILLQLGYIQTNAYTLIGHFITSENLSNYPDWEASVVDKSTLCNDVEKKSMSENVICFEAYGLQQGEKTLGVTPAS